MNNLGHAEQYINGDDECITPDFHYHYFYLGYSVVQFWEYCLIFRKKYLT